MTSRVAGLGLLFTCLATALQSAEDAPKTSMKNVLKARIAEDAKKAESKKAAPASTPATESTRATPVENGKAAPVAEQPRAATKSKKTAPSETPTVLPQVEVKKSRITELDRKLAKQEQDIARERRNLKATEVDSALNDSKVAKPLAIFGGESTQFRQRVASERVELMETEKDLIEAIARAKTKEEKQMLQKQLDELKMVRRELERALR